MHFQMFSDYLSRKTISKFIHFSIVLTGNTNPIRMHTTLFFIKGWENGVMKGGLIVVSQELKFVMNLSVVLKINFPELISNKVELSLLLEITMQRPEKIPKQL